MVKKVGPCCHCRVVGSPLWRHGPPEKPVLCNACGTRWRKKGTLDNYTPAPQVQRKQPKETPIRKTVKKKHNSLKTGDAADTFSNNPSGFGSALSYSGSAQSHAQESLVPSRKKSCVGRRKPSTVESLAEVLNSIMHEEQSCSGSAVRTIPGSSDEDLLIYHSETPASCFEIGYGSMLLTHPNSVSEANSVPAHSKSYVSVTSQSYSGPASLTLHRGSNGASNSNAASEKLMWAHESARRHKLHYLKQHILESNEVGGRGNAGGAYRGLTKSTMKSLKRLYESQPQILTGQQSALNRFMLPPGKLSSMPAPSDKDGDQDSLLLEVPRNARHPAAELLRCCPRPSQLSSVTLTAASPPSYQSHLH